MIDALPFRIAVLLLAGFFCLAAEGHSSGEMDNRRRWQSMTPEEKGRVIDNYRQWKSRPQESRDRIHRNFETYRDLTPEERQTLRERYRTYRNLEPEGKEKLRERLHRVAPPADRNSQDMTRSFRRLREMPPEERMRRVERSRFWRELSKEEREMYKKLIIPEN